MSSSKCIVTIFRKLSRALRLAIWRNVYPFLGAEYVGRGCELSISGGATVRSAGRLCISNYCSIVAQHGSLTLGRNLFIGIGTVIVCREAITIGNNTLIAEHVTIRDHDHVFATPLPPAQAGFLSEPIFIGDNVWLGAKVTVLKGVTIGNNVVVGANSVVTRDLPDNVLAAGVPARVIRRIDRAGRRP